MFEVFYDTKDKNELSKKMKRLDAAIQLKLSEV